MTQPNVLQVLEGIPTNPYWPTGHARCTVYIQTTYRRRESSTYVLPPPNKVLSKAPKVITGAAWRVLTDTVSTVLRRSSHCYEVVCALFLNKITHLQKHFETNEDCRGTWARVEKKVCLSSTHACVWTRREAAITDTHTVRYRAKRAGIPTVQIRAETSLNVYMGITGIYIFNYKNIEK